MKTRQLPFPHLSWTTTMILWLLVCTLFRLKSSSGGFMALKKQLCCFCERRKIIQIVKNKSNFFVHNWNSLDLFHLLFRFSSSLRCKPVIGWFRVRSVSELSSCGPSSFRPQRLKNALARWRSASDQISTESWFLSFCMQLSVQDKDRTAEVQFCCRGSLQTLSPSFAIFGDEGRQQVSVRSLWAPSWKPEDFVDSRRAKDEVVAEAHQTGGEPVQSHGLWGWREKNRRQSRTCRSLSK